MPDLTMQVLTYVLLPVAATILGGIIAAFRQPGPSLSSAIQHFAAGVVFAATAGEVLPEISGEHEPLAVITGFAIGVALMLWVKSLAEGQGQRGVGGSDRPRSLLIAVGIDIFIDGLLIGVGFAAGAKVGVLLTIALTLELLFLGLSVASALSKAGTARNQVIVTVSGLALLPLISAVVGVTLLSQLTGFALAAVLAFGAAALLYLVTEELLVEAHEGKETPLLTSAFFLGFIALFLIETSI